MPHNKKTKSHSKAGQARHMAGAKCPECGMNMDGQGGPGKTLKDMAQKAKPASFGEAFLEDKPGTPIMESNSPYLRMRSAAVDPVGKAFIGAGAAKTLYDLVTKGDIPRKAFKLAGEASPYMKMAPGLHLPVLTGIAGMMDIINTSRAGDVEDFKRNKDTGARAKQLQQLMHEKGFSPEARQHMISQMNDGSGGMPGGLPEWGYSGNAAPVNDGIGDRNMPNHYMPKVAMDGKGGPLSFSNWPGTWNPEDGHQPSDKAFEAIDRQINVAPGREAAAKSGPMSPKGHPGVNGPDRPYVPSNDELSEQLYDHKYGTHGRPGEPGYPKNSGVGYQPGMPPNDAKVYKELELRRSNAHPLQPSTPGKFGPGGQDYQQSGVLDSAGKAGYGLSQTGGIIGAAAIEGASQISKASDMAKNDAEDANASRDLLAKMQKKLEGMRAKKVHAAFEAMLVAPEKEKPALKAHLKEMLKALDFKRTNEAAMDRQVTNAPSADRVAHYQDLTGNAKMPGGAGAYSPDGKGGPGKNAAAPQQEKEEPYDPVNFLSTPLHPDTKPDGQGGAPASKAPVKPAQGLQDTQKRAQGMYDRSGSSGAGLSSEMMWERMKASPINSPMHTAHYETPMADGKGGDGSYNDGMGGNGHYNGDADGCGGPGGFDEQPREAGESYPGQAKGMPNTAPTDDTVRKYRAAHPGPAQQFERPSQYAPTALTRPIVGMPLPSRNPGPLGKLNERVGIVAPPPGMPLKAPRQLPRELPPNYRGAMPRPQPSPEQLHRQMQDLYQQLDQRIRQAPRPPLSNGGYPV